MYIYKKRKMGFCRIILEIDKQEISHNKYIYKYIYVYAYLISKVYVLFRSC